MSKKGSWQNTESLLSHIQKKQQQQQKLNVAPIISQDTTQIWRFVSGGTVWLLSSLLVKSLYACVSPWVYLSRQATLALCVKCVSEYTMRGRFHRLHMQHLAACY